MIGETKTTSIKKTSCTFDNPFLTNTISLTQLESLKPQKIHTFFAKNNCSIKASNSSVGSL